MEANDKIALRRTHTAFRSSLNVDAELVSSLITKEVLSPEDKRQIEIGRYSQPREDSEKVDALLDLLPRLGKSAFKSFYDALQESSSKRNRDLAEDLWKNKHSGGRQVSASESTDSHRLSHPVAESQRDPQSDPLMVAIKSYPWTREHTLLLRERLPLEEQRQLIAILQQGFPVQCTDEEFVGDPVDLPPAAPHIRTPIAAQPDDATSAHATEECQPESKQFYRDAVVVKPNNPPLSFGSGPSAAESPSSVGGGNRYR